MLFQKFLTVSEEQEIVAHIARAEASTTGEIHVHIHEGRSKSEDVLHAAMNAFHKLELHKSKDRNAVLIYIDVKQRRASILGDKGIHAIIGDQGWNQVIRDLMQSFKNDDRLNGIKAAIDTVSSCLQKQFPLKRGEEHKNQLSNLITHD